jgi:hypothetical protein
MPQGAFFRPLFPPGGAFSPLAAKNSAPFAPTGLGFLAPSEGVMCWRGSPVRKDHGFWRDSRHTTTDLFGHGVR